MPTINLVQWNNIPDDLKKDIFVLMEHATKFCQQIKHTAFRDVDRTRIAATVLNTKLGHSGSPSKSCFEFIHIVVTHNTKLNKHVDMKNDHRPGYNHCVVYSFLSL